MWVDSGRPSAKMGCEPLDLVHLHICNKSAMSEISYPYVVAVRRKEAQSAEATHKVPVLEIMPLPFFTLMEEGLGKKVGTAW